MKKRMVDKFIRRKSSRSEFGRENATFSEYLKKEKNKSRDSHLIQKKKAVLVFLNKIVWN